MCLSLFVIFIYCYFIVVRLFSSILFYFISTSVNTFLFNKVFILKVLVVLCFFVFIIFFLTCNFICFSFYNFTSNYFI